MKKFNYKEGDPVSSRATFVREVPTPEGMSKQGMRAIMKCECGRLFETVVKSVRSKDGGCLFCAARKAGDVNFKHGFANKSKVYKLWTAIKDRCFNEKCKEYKYYGGRGITMYEPWRNDFQAFYDVVGEPPTPKHSFDRFPNNDGNYEPGNWRWATKSEQARNTRTSIWVDYYGERLNIRDLAERLGLDPEIVYNKYQS